MRSAGGSQRGRERCSEVKLARLPSFALAKPWAGARRRLAAAVGPCRADCAAVLALGSRRRTHYAHGVRCVQTSCDESVSRSALRAPTQALRSSPPQMRAATHPPTALRETLVLWVEERRDAGLEPASRRDARAVARAANRRLDACDSPSLLQEPAVPAKTRAGGVRSASAATSSAGVPGRARSALRELTCRSLFERSERSERSEFCDGPEDRAAQCSRRAAPTAAAKRSTPPARVFAHTELDVTCLSSKRTT